MKNLKQITSEAEMVSQNYGVIYQNKTTDDVIVKPRVAPQITITLADSYTDTSVIGLTATKTISVEGEIVWSTDLAESVATIENNTLKFLQHYEGTVNVTATASNASDSKQITVTCDEVATAYTYSVSNISSPTVAWNTTSTTITFTGETIAHYALKPSTTATSEQSEVVTFTQNEGSDNPMDLSVTSTEYVDLGLPSGLKWAKCNIGAQTESDYGAYFAWGDTKGYATATDKGGGTQRTIEDVFQWQGVDVNYTVKQNAPQGGFTWANTPYYSGSSSSDYTKYTPTDGKTVLEQVDDAAHVNMGGNWRMPTATDTTELVNNTTQTWYAEGNTEFNGVAGRKFTSKVDSTKYIFIPASGLCLGTSLLYRGTYGDYWSSSLFSSYPSSAYGLRFVSGNVSPQGYGDRYFGFCVRGVVSE